MGWIITKEIYEKHERNMIKCIVRRTSKNSGPSSWRGGESYADADADTIPSDLEKIPTFAPLNRLWDLEKLRVFPSIETLGRREPYSVSKETLRLEKIPSFPPSIEALGLEKFRAPPSIEVLGLRINLCPSK